MQLISRAGWGASAPESRTLLSPSALKGVTVHWFGSPKAASSHSDCDDLLRAVQRGHMAGEYADIAYNHAVCPHGSVYELRGFGVRTGANGSTEGNSTHAAIVYMAGTGDTFTDAAKRGLNFLIREWRARGAGSEVSPHRRWTGSTCPGPDVINWLSAGRPEATPAPAPTPPKEEPNLDERFPVWFDWYLFGRLAGKPRPASTVGLAITAAMWAVVEAAAEYRKAKPCPDESGALRARLAEIAKLASA